MPNLDDVFLKVKTWREGKKGIRLTTAALATGLVLGLSACGSPAQGRQIEKLSSSQPVQSSPSQTTESSLKRVGVIDCDNDFTGIETGDIRLKNEIEIEEEAQVTPKELFPTSSSIFEVVYEDAGPADPSVYVNNRPEIAENRMVAVVEKKKKTMADFKESLELFAYDQCFPVMDRMEGDPPLPTYEKVK